MTRTLLPALLLVLSACNTVDDYFSSLATEALLLGIEDPPEDVDFDLGEAASVTAYVAEARSLSSFSANLVDDATVTFGGRALPRTGHGLYSADSSSDAALDYVAGTSYVLAIVEDGTNTVSVTAPPAPDLVGAPGPQETHQAGAGMSIDLSGQGFDNQIVLVGTSDGQGGASLTWDSRPTSADEYIDWIGGNGDVGTVVIPGSAFPDADTIYLLGVAGIVRAPDSAFDGLNPLVSNLASGQVATAIVRTAP